MAGLRVTVFDVEHGLCALIETPSGHGIMYDCGCAKDFSPVRYVHQRVKLLPHNGLALATLIVSHPHDDHIEDIRRLKTELPPASIFRQHYVWNEIKQPGVVYPNLDAYSAWQATYDQPATYPAWGMNVTIGPSLPPTKAKTLMGNFVNNSSIPLFLEYAGRKVTLVGDLEVEGWAELLKDELFCERLRRTDFFVASHHGHSSGFSAGAFAVIGKPWMNIVPVHHGDTNVDTRYSSPDYARGMDFGGRKRYMLSTRTDGTVFISITDVGNASIHAERLQPNV